MNQQTPVQYPWLPVVIDLFTLAGGAALVPTAVSQFGTLSTINALLLAAAYIFFCFSVFWFKRLEPLTETGVLRLPEWLQRQTTLRILGVIFGLFFATLIALELGYFQSILQVDVRELGSGESSALLVYGPGSWLGAALFYMLILSSTASPSILRHHPRYRVWPTIGLLGVNGMLLLATAVLTPFLSSWVWAIPLLLLYVIVFVPPRLIYWTKRPFFAPAAASYALLIIVAIAVIILL